MEKSNKYSGTQTEKNLEVAFGCWISGMVLY